jgi:hypothetical protein
VRAVPNTVVIAMALLLESDFVSSSFTALSEFSELIDVGINPGGDEVLQEMTTRGFFSWLKIAKAGRFMAGIFFCSLTT